MTRSTDRHPANAPGDWYVDQACINCGASQTIAPGLIVERDGQSVFARQPRGEEEELAAWRAGLVCPTASVRTESRRKAPDGVFPQELAPGVSRCGYNARDSYGAHSYFVKRGEGNFLVDAPRYVGRLVSWFQATGGIRDILLTHQDDVADAERYAKQFGARVWIHEHDRAAAPFATEIVRGREPTPIRPGLAALPVPGHTRGSVVFLLEDSYLFTGDSLSWDHEAKDLEAFRDACWFSWEEQTRSLARLAGYRFEWILPGHGGSVRLPADGMNRRLVALVQRMGLPPPNFCGRWIRRAVCNCGGSRLRRVERVREEGVAVMAWMANPEVWIALATLTVLEIVLGIDNIIFISILIGRLPAREQRGARIIGLSLAMLTRILLLFSLVWLMRLTAPLFSVFDQEISGRDLILISGGLFLLWKSTSEIHENMEGKKPSLSIKAGSGFAGVIIQIILIDIVFSLDSVITAIGMSGQLAVMTAAIVIAVIVMLVLSDGISRFVNRHPTVKMLALSFLILIGVALIGDGLGMHIPKGYIYFAMAFSVLVEMMNLRIRKRHEARPRLPGGYAD